MCGGGLLPRKRGMAKPAVLRTIVPLDRYPERSGGHMCTPGVLRRSSAQVSCALASGPRPGRVVQQRTGLPFPKKVRDLHHSLSESASRPYLVLVKEGFGLGEFRPQPRRCDSRRCLAAVMRWSERAGVWHGMPDWGNPGPAGVLMPKSGRMNRWCPDGAEAGAVCGATGQRRISTGEKPGAPSFQRLESGAVSGWVCVQNRAEGAQGGVGCSARASALRAGRAASRCRRLPTSFRPWGVGATQSTWNGTEARRGTEDDRA